MTPNANEVNILILNFVESTLLNLLNGNFEGNIKDFYERYDWNNKDYLSDAINIDYRIMRNDSYYLSIVFEGLCNHKTAAHPTDRFITLTIDKINKKIIFIDDLFRIDDFIQFLQSNYKELVREGLARKFQVSPDVINNDVVQIILDYTSDEELSKIKAKLTSNNEYYPFFLTDNAIGISISIPFVLGDHFEILINYDELTKYLIDGVEL